MFNYSLVPLVAKTFSVNAAVVNVCRIRKVDYEFLSLFIELPHLRTKV